MRSSVRTALLVALCLPFTGCSSEQQAADEHAAAIEDALSQSTASDDSATNATMPEGCYLRAVIDGQKWEATEMTPDRSHPSIIPVSGKNGSSSITFTISGMRAGVGQPSNLSDMNTITYWSGENILGAKQGQVTVQKMDDQFIEGTFEFTADKDGQNVTCTDGEFRVPARRSRY